MPSFSYCRGMLTAVVTAEPGGGLTLTVRSDRRRITGTVVVAGETAPFTAVLPVRVEDEDRTWIPVSDDGVTATYRA